MSHQIRLTNSQITQVLGLIDLNEQEQEMISGFGGRDDAWTLGFTIKLEPEELQKNWTDSNFRLDISGLPTNM